MLEERVGFVDHPLTIRMDNSEYTRNGDYTPSRMEAQKDAVTFLFNAKTQSNPENTVGLMTNAGKGYVSTGSTYFKT